MRIPTGILLVVLIGASGCLSRITDPLDRRGSFEDTQMKFTQYVRWGKFEEASKFVDPEMREQFMSYAPKFTDLRFSDYEINGIEMTDELMSATVQVRYTGCLPETSLVHELIHWRLLEATGDPDKGHTDVLWYLDWIISSEFMPCGEG